MGDWGYQPWENDEACDWFHKFWTKGGILVLKEEVNNFNVCEEKYDSIRAAAYVLQTFGNPYTWNSEYSNDLKPLLDKVILILNNMINPPNEDWTFLDIGGNRELLINAVKEQIFILEKQRNALCN